jgi:hypothetical protein
LRDRLGAGKEITVLHDERLMAAPGDVEHVGSLAFLKAARQAIAFR